MASSIPLVVVLTLACFLATASAKGSAALNLTDILVRGSQYTTFIHLLSVTQAGTQIQNQLNNSQDGVTVFAPTDNAFNNLKPGTLNSLTQQQQVALVLYHVIPKFYTLDSFETASNPLRTQASGNGGDFYLNVSSSAQQTNLTTGLVDVPVASSLNVTMPLAVYSVDKVLLPFDLFGPKKKAAAPAASEPVLGAPKGTAPATSDTPATNGTAASEQSTGARTAVGVGGWRWMVAMGISAAVIVMGM